MYKHTNTLNKYNNLFNKRYIIKATSARISLFRFQPALRIPFQLPIITHWFQILFLF